MLPAARKTNPMASASTCDPEDDPEEIEPEPDLPDEWLDCSEDHDDCLIETIDAEGWPTI